MGANKESQGTEIRQAVQDDLQAIVDLERSIANAPHWPAEIYKAMVCATAQAEIGLRRCLLVAIDGRSQVVGFAAGAVHETEQAELETVVVHSGRRRQGIGRALCLWIVQWVRARGAAELSLEVRASSGAARGLYDKLGFQVVGERFRYYRAPEEDAIIMKMALR